MPNNIMRSVRESMLIIIKKILSKLQMQKKTKRRLVYRKNKRKSFKINLFKFYTFLVNSKKINSYKKKLTLRKGTPKPLSKRIKPIQDRKSSSDFDVNIHDISINLYYSNSVISTSFSSKFYSNNKSFGYKKFFIKVTEKYSHIEKEKIRVKSILVQSKLIKENHPILILFILCIEVPIEKSIKYSSNNMLEQSCYPHSNILDKNNSKPIKKSIESKLAVSAVSVIECIKNRYTNKHQINDIKGLELLIDICGQKSLNVPNKNGNTALIVAACCFDVFAIEQLLRKKVNIFSKNNEGTSALEFIFSRISQALKEEEKTPQTTENKDLKLKAFKDIIQCAILLLKAGKLINNKEVYDHIDYTNKSDKNIEKLIHQVNKYHTHKDSSDIILNEYKINEFGTILQCNREK